MGGRGRRAKKARVEEKRRGKEDIRRKEEIGLVGKQKEAFYAEEKSIK